MSSQSSHCWSSTIDWGVSFVVRRDYVWLRWNTLKLARTIVFACNLRTEDTCVASALESNNRKKRMMKKYKKIEMRQTNKRSISSVFFLSHGKPDDDDFNMYFQPILCYLPWQKINNGKNGARNSKKKFFNFQFCLCADFRFPCVKWHWPLKHWELTSKINRITDRKSIHQTKEKNKLLSHV
jgi:hypothetical protein